MAGDTIETAPSGREGEQRLQAAKTQEERSIVIRDMNIFRLNRIFSGDEAALIKGVLGTNPAVKLLEMCRAVS